MAEGGFWPTSRSYTHQDSRKRRLLQPVGHQLRRVLQSGQPTLAYVHAKRTRKGAVAKPNHSHKHLQSDTFQSWHLSLFSKFVIRWPLLFCSGLLHHLRFFFKLLFSQVFRGNRDPRSIVTEVVSPAIVSRYIRIHPRKWKNHISMRVDFLGCRSGKRNTKRLVLLTQNNNCSDWDTTEMILSYLTYLVPVWKSN